MITGRKWDYSTGTKGGRRIAGRCGEGAKNAEGAPLKG